MHIIPPHKYDTPTNIIEKQGDIYRAMSDRNPSRPLFVRIIIILFGLFYFIPAGLFCLFMGTATVLDDFKLWTLLPFLVIVSIGLLLTGSGIMAIYNNIRK